MTEQTEQKDSGFFFLSLFVNPHWRLFFPLFLETVEGSERERGRGTGGGRGRKEEEKGKERGREIRRGERRR